MGKFGVPGWNVSGERLVELYSELGLVMGYTCFRNKELICIHGKGS